METTEPKDCAHHEKQKRARSSSGCRRKRARRSCSKRRRSRKAHCGKRRRKHSCKTRRKKHSCKKRRKSRCGRSRHRRKKTHRTCCRTPCGTFKRCNKCDKRWKLRLPKRCRSHSGGGHSY